MAGGEATGLPLEGRLIAQGREALRSIGSRRIYSLRWLEMMASAATKWAAMKVTWATHSWGSQSHEEDQSVSAADDQGGHGPDRALRKMQRRSGQPPRSADRASFAATKDVSCPWGVLRRPISVLRFPSDAPQRCQTTRDRPGPGYQPGPFSCVTCTGELASNARFPPASGYSRFAFRSPYVYRRSENFTDFGYGAGTGPRSCGFRDSGRLESTQDMFGHAEGAAGVAAVPRCLLNTSVLCITTMADRRRGSEMYFWRSRRTTVKISRGIPGNPSDSGSFL